MSFSGMTWMSDNYLPQLRNHDELYLKQAILGTKTLGVLFICTLKGKVIYLRMLLIPGN